MRGAASVAATAIWLSAATAVADPEPAPVPAPTPAAVSSGTDWMATLGSLERQSVQRALAARGFTLEPAPEGKVIARVHIYNEDVFAEDNFLAFFNHFHVTTREAAIAKELVIGEGEVWDKARVEETARRLRDPLWTTVVAVVPVVAADPTKIDLLVVTRDVWSLRLNTKYAFYVDDTTRKLTNLTVSLSENNFLGTRAVVALGMTMDQGEIATGPVFLNRNLFGEHLSLSARADVIYNRDDLLQRSKLTREGSDSSITLARPLWQLASEWGWSVAFAHSYAIARSFVGTNLRTFDDPSTPDVEALPYVYSSKVIASSANVTRQWGTALKQQLAGGLKVSSTRAAPFDFAGTDAQRDAFVHGVLPRSELAVGPYLAYSGFQPRYKTLRNISTYDLGEDARYGADYGLTLDSGVRALGSDANFLRGTVSAGYTQPWCSCTARDGFVRLSGSVSMRRQPGVLLDRAYIDNTATTTLRIVTPTQWHARLVLESTLATRWYDTQNRFYTIGQDSGLRGFVIDQFAGKRYFSTQAELRTAPWALWMFRVGGVAFYELGGAANALATMPLHQDVGVGLRALIPQTSRELFRFDFAIPLDGRQAGALRFLAGFESAF